MPPILVRWWFSVFLLAAILALQFPFLKADPHIDISIGRDAFTDEGLNTSQIRNYINHGQLIFDECDNLIKSPLFNLMLFAPLKVFGTSWLTARLTVLLSVIIVLLWLLSMDAFRRVFPFLFLTTLLQYHIFQYSHFSLSEMISTVFILTGLWLIYQFTYLRNKQSIILSALFLSAAYFCKVQFIYIVVLLPAAILIAERNEKIVWSKKIFSKNILVSIKSIALFFAAYILFWIIPHHEIFLDVLNEESGEKFADWHQIPKTMAFNIIYVLFSGENKWFHGLVIICIATGIKLFRRSDDRNFKNLFLLSALWVIIEAHKLTMIYLPSRYMVSFYFAEGFLCSVVIEHLFRSYFFTAGAKTVNKIFAASLLLMFVLLHISLYLTVYNDRQFQIQKINRYMAAATKNSRPVLGPWSPCATWQSKDRSIPVWNNFMNDRDAIPLFQPQAILSEPNEDDSNKAWSAKGIDLKLTADSSRDFKIGKWNVIIYWMKH